MLQRVLAAVLVVVGLLSIGLAIASATVWRPLDVVTATTSTTSLSGQATVLVTAPGVIDLVNQSVDLTATRSDGGPVTVAVGREVDVRGWVGDDAHALVTGLSSWSALDATLVAGQTVPVPDDAAEPDDVAEPSPKPSASKKPADKETKPSDDKTTKPSDDKTTKPADDKTTAPAAEESAAPDAAASGGTSGIVGPNAANSDMWLAVASGDASASLTWEAPAERAMIVVTASGDGAPMPTLTMAWHREVSTPWLVPGLIIGVLALVGAGLVILRGSDVGQSLAISGRRAVVAPIGALAGLLANRAARRELAVTGADRAETSAQPAGSGSALPDAAAGSQDPAEARQFSPLGTGHAGPTSPGTPGARPAGSSPYDHAGSALPASGHAPASGAGAPRPSEPGWGTPPTWNAAPPRGPGHPGTRPGEPGAAAAPGSARLQAAQSEAAARQAAQLEAAALRSMGQDGSHLGAGPAPAAQATGGAPMTRREMREAAEQATAAAAAEKTRRRPRTGTLPIVRAGRKANAVAAHSETPPEDTPRFEAVEAIQPDPNVAGDDVSAARADAWRKAWGFQQEWSPEPADTATSDSGADPEQASHKDQS